MVPAPRGVIVATAAHRAQRREEVELERGLEVGVADVHEAVEAQLHAADVVDQHVEPAVLLDGVVDEPGRAFGIDQIDGEGLDAFEAVQGRHGARPGDDVRALGGELVGHGQADALARPGDHRDLAGQLQVHARTLQVDAGIPAEEVDPPSSRARRLVATASPSSADP
jgi:hypothetical protein